MNHTIIAGLSLLAAIGIAGCGTTKTADTPGRTVVGHFQTAQVPTFTLTTLTHSQITIPYKGVTILYFMSSQCGSCIQGEKQLALLQPKLPSSVHIVSLGISPEYGTPQGLINAAESTGANWPQTFATPNLLQTFHITRLEQTVVISSQDQIVFNTVLPPDAVLMQVIQEAQAK